MQELLATTPGLASTYAQLEHASNEPRHEAWFAGRKYLEEGAIEEVMRGTASPAEALRRLEDLVATAAATPKLRRPTRPTRSSVEKRLAGKARRAAVKSGRGRVDD